MITRYFCKGDDPFADTKWAEREVLVNNKKCKVEAPESWSDLAVKIVAGKYFTKEETSVKQLIDRVAKFLAKRGLELGYFNAAESETFYREIAWLCLNQYGAFNSPVWFNVGVKDAYGRAGSPHNYYFDMEKGKALRCPDTYSYPQASACFIQSVQDNMDDIMRLAKSEAMLFKHGSGTGTNLSSIRSSKEYINGGGTASGPLSFMRIFNEVAGVVKSAGVCRRAALMRCLDASHPDIEEFVSCKVKEEQKAQALIKQGYDGSFDGEAYDSVQYQNANNSVRATDEFMQAVQDDATWATKAVVDGKPMKTYKARKLFQDICEATRLCGDPGMQYHDTINSWHTCKDAGEIRASNPCSEFMFIDDSACNLASLNLSKFVKRGEVDTASLSMAVERFIIAQDILVDAGSYPEKNITENSHTYRPLGLGYCDLGAVLMKQGIPYDSKAGTDLCSSITSYLTGFGYLTSAKIAKKLGAFDQFDTNRGAMLNVITRHRDASVTNGTSQVWDEVYSAGLACGFRNAQVTVLAPTGTIGFMLDCSTTGIEPELALVKYKSTVGGETFTLVNNSVVEALTVLGYEQDTITSITQYINETGTIEGSRIKPEHLPVFDCAFKSNKGTRSLGWSAHINMMAAAQPFLSGAISKTVNMPKGATRAEIEEVYMTAWKRGLKAVAIFVDECKANQPLNTKKKTKGKQINGRNTLPDTRHSITHRFSVGDHTGYLTVGLYDNGMPGELFINISKEGSLVHGVLDALATQVSIGLQYGMPLDMVINKFLYTSFEPKGMTAHKEIPFASSILDYIGKWLQREFIDKKPTQSDVKPMKMDMPIRTCPECGAIATPNGSCYRCDSCGASLGCS